MFTEYFLENKSRVILAPQTDTKSVTVLVMFPVGSRYEPARLAGVSHYIEHLMFKGTEKRPSTLVLTREIDRLGAEYNAFTGKEYTGYYIKVDGAYAEIALDILSDMLLHSLFDPKEMEREKGPIVEEIRMYKDNPLMNIDNVFEDVLYAGCPLGRAISGSEKHVMSYRRPEVLRYKAEWYRAHHMTVVLAGHVHTETRTLVETYFGTHRNGRASTTRRTAPAAFGPGAKEKRLVVERKHTDQTQIMLGFPGFSHTDRRNPAAAVMNTILGGSMSSRLFIQVRERHGLAYMVKSGTETFQDTGYVYVRAGLEAKNINPALRLIAKEIRKMSEKGVSAQELADAKTHIRGGMTLAMEDSSAQANWYAKEALFQKRIRTPEEVLDQVDAVTLSDVKSVAQQLFRMRDMRLAIIGDIDKERIAFSY